MSRIVVAQDFNFETKCNPEKLGAPSTTAKFASERCPNFAFVRNCINYSSLDFASNEELEEARKPAQAFVRKSYDRCVEHCENQDAGACVIIGEAYFNNVIFPKDGGYNKRPETWLASYFWHHKACEMGEVYGCTQAAQRALGFWKPHIEFEDKRWSCNENYDLPECVMNDNLKKFAQVIEGRVASPLRLWQTACEMAHAQSCVQLVKFSQNYPDEVWDGFDAEIYKEKACAFGNQLTCRSVGK